MYIIAFCVLVILTFSVGYLLGKILNESSVNKAIYGKKEVMSYCQRENERHGWRIKDYFLFWKDKRIAIYGKNGLYTCHLLKECGEKSFSYIIDRLANEPEIYGLPLISPTEISEYSIDVIIITSLAHGKEIKDSLQESGYIGEVYTYFELVYCLKIVKEKLPVRVAISTWAGYHSLNYGSYFQNMALQSILKKFGYQPITLVVDGIDENRLQRLKKYFRIPKYIHMNFKFRVFSRNRVSFGKALLNYHDAIEDVIKNRCVILLSGGDAIWLYQFINDCFVWNFDELSDFPKISYAASMSLGSLFSAERGASIAQYSAISVREATMIPKMSFNTEDDEEIRKNIFVALDSVLLDDQDFWIKNAARPLIKQTYILCYLFDPERCPDTIEEIRKRHNAEKIKYLDMNVIDQFYLGGKNYNYNGNSISFVGPAEFLSLIKNAEAIVTDSYHGTLFSVLFHKQVYHFQRKYVDACGIYGIKTDARFDEIWEKLCIGNRYVNSPQAARNIKDIDYKKVDIALKKEKENSLTYLENSLKNAQQKWMNGSIFYDYENRMR